MKWIQGAIILTVLTLVPSVLSRHIDRSSEEAEAQVQTDTSSAKRQLRKTHLRLHGKPPKTVHRQEGDSAFLECQAGGTPAPTIHWLKDGVVVSQIEESHVSDMEVNSKSKVSVSFTTSRLYLDCLSLEDEGQYSCVAENPYHRISTDTQLTVTSSDDDVTCRKKSHGQAPRMVQWTKTLIGTQGEPTKMTCRADGYPRPTIRWLGANDEELTTADFSKYQVLPQGDLVIHKVDWNDMGTFTCIAENVHGEAKAQVFLYPAVTDA